MQECASHSVGHARHREAQSGVLPAGPHAHDHVGRCAQLPQSSNLARWILAIAIEDCDPPPAGHFKATAQRGSLATISFKMFDVHVGPSPRSGGKFGGSGVAAAVVNAND